MRQEPFTLSCRSCGRFGGRRQREPTCRCVASLFRRFLFSQGASLDVADLRGYSALHYCSLKGHLELFQWLLEAGANPRARTLAVRQTHRRTIS